MIFDAVDPEIYAITARADAAESGMISTWVLPATLIESRPRLVAAFSPGGFTLELIEKSGRFVVHLLSESQHALVPRFGIFTGRMGDKFEGLEVERTVFGIARIPGCAGFAECSVIEKTTLLDRLVILAHVDFARSDPNLRPLTISRATKLLTPGIVESIERKRRADGERDLPWPKAA